MSKIIEKVYISATPPKVTNVLWLQPETHKIYAAMGQQWVEVSESGGDLSDYYTKAEVDEKFADKQDTLTAGQNISIEDNTVAAKGYLYDDEPKEELKLIDDILAEAGVPLSLGLKISGAAGATTYTYNSDMFLQIIQFGLLPGVGATYQTANGKSGVIVAVDATTITFEETLDADNALTNEPVDYVVDTVQPFSFAEGIYDYIETDISAAGLTLSGAAGATTYTYGGVSVGADTLINRMFRLQGGRSAKSVSVDTTNRTITFEETLDADNALADELVVSLAAKNIASGKYSHVEGGGVLDGVPATNTASGAASHSEGVATNASGIGSHSEGVMTNASGIGSHSEGRNTSASGIASHTEGNRTSASGESSHAEGSGTIADGEYSHAEGSETTASGQYSHAEGAFTTASGEDSHAEGSNTAASGYVSHAEGYYTTSQNHTEHAEGKYNVSHKASGTYGDVGNTQHSVGIGVGSSSSRKNAFEIMQNGDMYVLGVGGYQGTDTKVQNATIKTLQEYIASLEARITALENGNS